MLGWVKIQHSLIHCCPGLTSHPLETIRQRTCVVMSTTKEHVLLRVIITNTISMKYNFSMPFIDQVFGYYSITDFSSFL